MMAWSKSVTRHACERASGEKLDRRLVLTTERDATRRLKALLAGEAALITRQGRHCITYTRAYRSPVLATLTPAQEETLMQSYTRLRACQILSVAMHVDRPGSAIAPCLARNRSSARGYTIYSTQGGRCCIHGKHGCVKLRGQFVCFSDVEEAKTLIKRFRAEGYTSCDSVERYLPSGSMCA